MRVRDTTIILRSRDGGSSWGDESLPGDTFNEFSLCHGADGFLLAAARNEKGAVFLLESGDHGRTWSAGNQVTREGEHPADLILLASGSQASGDSCGGWGDSTCQALHCSEGLFG